MDTRGSGEGGSRGGAAGAGVAGLAESERGGGGSSSPLSPSLATREGLAGGTATTPRWSKSWVDPLRSGDIFTRSWASPLPIRARRSSFPQSPNDSGLGPSMSPISGAMVTGSPVAGVQLNDAGRSPSQDPTVPRTAPLSSAGAGTAHVDVSNPAWAQKVRSNFDALVRASPMPRALIDRTKSPNAAPPTAAAPAYGAPVGGGAVNRHGAVQGLGGSGNDDATAPPTAASSGSALNSVELSEWSLWILKPADGSAAQRRNALPIALRGKRRVGDDDDETWTSAAIVTRIGHRQLVDADGTQIDIRGEMDTRATAAAGISVTAIRAFSSGFPSIWDGLLGNKLSLAPPPKPKIVSIPSSLPNPFASTNVMKKLKMPTPPLPPPPPKRASDPTGRSDGLRESIGGVPRRKYDADVGALRPPPGWHEGNEVVAAAAPATDADVAPREMDASPSMPDTLHDSNGNSPTHGNGVASPFTTGLESTNAGDLSRGTLPLSSSSNAKDGAGNERIATKQKLAGSGAKRNNDPVVRVKRSGVGSARELKHLQKSQSTILFKTGDAEIDDSGSKSPIASKILTTSVGSPLHGRTSRGRRVMKPVEYWKASSSGGGGGGLGHPAPVQRVKEQSPRKRVDTVKGDDQPTTSKSVTKKAQSKTHGTKSSQRGVQLTAKYSYIGMRVRKRSNGVDYGGTVERVLLPPEFKRIFYRVRYDDDLEEDYTEERLEELLAAAAMDDESRDPSLRSSSRSRKRVQRYGDIVEYSPSRRKRAKNPESPIAVAAGAPGNMLASLPRQRDSCAGRWGADDGANASASGEADHPPSQDRTEWTPYQIQALNVAVARVDPLSKNQWVKIAKMVPGKTAGECQDRYWAGHPTPKEQVARSKSRRNVLAGGSPIASMAALESAAVKSTAPLDIQRRTAAARATALRKNARDSRWKLRAAELGVGTADDPFGFDAAGDQDELDGETAEYLEETQQNLMKKMKKQKTFDAYIEPTLKRRLKGGGLRQAKGAGRVPDTKAKMSAAVRETNRMAIASANDRTADVVEDSEGEEVDPEEEKDVYFDS